jgi:hypothetical protein
VAKIATHTLDVLYAELAARGGPCTAHAHQRRVRSTRDGWRDENESSSRTSASGPSCRDLDVLDWLGATCWRLRATEPGGASPVVRCRPRRRDR